MNGVLSFCFGIALSSHRNGSGEIDDPIVTGVLAIVVGVISFVAGVLGVISYKDQRSHSKNGFHMGFSIAACCISVVAIFFDSVVVR